MFFNYITLFVALSISGVAIYYSIAGLVAIFAAAVVPIIVMGTVLEVGKLVSASWVYRNWQGAPFLLKSYLTIAVIILVLITSMGIFGFLSKAHLEQAAGSVENTARIERIVEDITRYEVSTDRLEDKILKLDDESEVDTSKIQEQIDTEEARMDNVMVRIQPAIDEQNLIITNDLEKDDEKVAPYLKQMENLDNEIVKLEELAKKYEDDITNVGKLDNEIAKLEELAKKYEDDITNVGKDSTSYDYAVQPFQEQIDKINSDIATLKEMSKSGTQEDLKKAQAAVGIPWGFWRNSEVLKEWYDAQAVKLTELRTKIADTRKDFEGQYKEERARLRNLVTKLRGPDTQAANDRIKEERIRLGNMVTKLRGPDTQAVNERKMELLVKIEEARGTESVVVSSAREEIKRLREKADREVASSLIILERLRDNLLNVSQIDNSVEIDEIQLKINDNNQAIDGLIDEKFQLERVIRQIETEIGPIKYIAEMVYGNTERDTIDQAVRWLIIVFIFVFDPLAVLLLLAANYGLHGGTPPAPKPKKKFFKKKLRDEDDPQQSEDNKIEPIFKYDYATLIGKTFQGKHHKEDDADYLHLPSNKVEQAVPDKTELISEIFKEAQHEEEVALTDKIWSPEERMDIIGQSDDVVDDEKITKPKAIKKKPKKPKVIKKKSKKRPIIKGPIKSKVSWQDKDVITQLIESESPDDYILYEDKLHRKPAFVVMHPEFVTDVKSTVEFGVVFPENVSNATLFIRTDFLPTKLYRFNGETWVELDKRLLKESAYSRKYISELISKINEHDYDHVLLEEVVNEGVHNKKASLFNSVEIKHITEFKA